MSHSQSYRTARLEAVAIANLLREATVRAAMLREELIDEVEDRITVAELVASACGEITRQLPDLCAALEDSAIEPMAQADRLHQALDMIASTTAH